MHIHVVDDGEGDASEGGDGDEEGPFGLGTGDEAEELLGGAGLGKEL